MPNPLRITNKLSVMPLLDIHHPAFAQSYISGVYWRLYGWRVHGKTRAQGPLPASNLIKNLRTIVELGYFDEQYSERLQKEVGFFIGMYHGGILSPETGCLRDDITTLAILDHPEAKCGYNVGRRDTYYSLVPDTKRYADTTLLEEQRQTVHDLIQYRDEQETWFYTMSCVLGSLSLQVFAVTVEEQQAWEAEYRLFYEKYEQNTAKVCSTEQVDAVLVVEYTV